MAAHLSTSLASTDTSGLRWGWLLALGVVVAGLGVVGLGAATYVTVVAVFWFGILSMAGGVVNILDAFHHRGWKGIIWHLLIGAIYIAAGFIIITTPLSSAFWLTRILAIFAIVIGVSRMIMAFRIRSEGSVWFAVLLSGLISVIFGFMILGVATPPTPEALATPAAQLEWVRTWGWVIGLVVSVELIMEGCTLIALALASRKFQQHGASGVVLT